jgi:hypothetical protein
MRLRIAAFMLLCSAPAFAAEVVTQQVLDRLYSFSTGVVLDVKFGNIGSNDPPVSNLGLSVPGVSSLNFATCAVTAVSGLYCLDGQVLRRWPNDQQPATPEKVLDCTMHLGVTIAKGDGCVAMTVDQKGQIWLSVKKRNSHSVYKVVRNGSSPCSTANPCTVSEPFVGRPPIVDLVPVEGELAKHFALCPDSDAPCGVIGIEERKNAVFFPDGSPSATTLVRATDWNLQGKELLQEITPLLLGTETPELGILATTTAGRVLARAIAGTGPAKAVPIKSGSSVVNLASCGTTGAQFGIRASATTGMVYISDRNCGRVLSLDPDNTTFSGLSELTYGSELAVANPVIGLSIAPGISLDLTDCSGSGATGGCALAYGVSGSKAARLQNVQLGTSTSGATVLQIQRIPDCRMVSAPGFPADLRQICVDAGKFTDVIFDSGNSPVDIVDESGNLLPIPASAKLQLNVTPLLPREVIDAFKASDLGQGRELPALLISRFYRAQSRNLYAFDAFFVIPQAGVQFVNVYNSEYDVGALEGQANVNNCSTPDSLIQWDITTHVSEIYGSVGGQYVDSLANVDCGSIRGAGASLSLLPYNLQVNPDTWDPDASKFTPGNDAVFARLLQNLYGELNVVLWSYACSPTADGGTQAPISATLCNSLNSIWLNGKTKLDKCIAAAFQPKSSASNENCQSWVSQLTNYSNSLPSTTQSWDKANRVGEQKARIQTLFHLYYKRFQPSIPALGFCREQPPIPPSTTPACANPWPAT